MKQSNSFLFKLCLSGMLLAVAVWPPYRAQEKTGTAEADYIIDTIAGGGTLADLIDPYGVAVDDTGNIYYVDFWDHRVLRIHPSGVIPTIVAGTGPGEGAGGGPGDTAGTVVRLWRRSCMVHGEWQWIQLETSTSPIPPTIAFAGSILPGPLPPSRGLDPRDLAGTAARRCRHS